MLELGWPLQQISGRLKTTYPDDKEMRVSHEAIYLTMYVQARGGLKRELAPGEGTDRQPSDDQQTASKSLTGLYLVSGKATL